MVKFFIVYELDQWSRYLGTDFTLGVSLFGDVTLIKNADPDKYSYSGYSFELDTRIEYSLLDVSVGIKCHYFWSS